MKTLYEILEVSENASEEVIEKAYKVLAKKYHPDLQQGENKQLAEKQMKQLNEAYSILSDETKRKQYDIKLKEKRDTAIKQEEVKNEQNQLQEEYAKKYQDAYEDYLKSLGYKIKHGWTWKKVKELLITILIIIAICLVLWFFPPTHKWIMDFYNSNFIIKGIVDVIVGIFKGIYNTFYSIFTGEKVL